MKKGAIIGFLIPLAWWLFVSISINTDFKMSGFFLCPEELFNVGGANFKGLFESSCGITGLAPLIVALIIFAGLGALVGIIIKTVIKKLKSFNQQ